MMYDETAIDDAEEVNDMATKTKAKAKDVEETTEAPEGTRPKDLAAELGVNPKSLRAFLRRQFPRGEAHNTSWYLNADQVTAAKAHFAKASDESDSDES